MSGCVATLRITNTSRKVKIISANKKLVVSLVLETTDNASAPSKTIEYAAAKAPIHCDKMYYKHSTTDISPLMIIAKLTAGL